MARLRGGGGGLDTAADASTSLSRQSEQIGGLLRAAFDSSSPAARRQLVDGLDRLRRASRVTRDGAAYWKLRGLLDDIASWPPVQTEEGVCIPLEVHPSLRKGRGLIAEQLMLILLQGEWLVAEEVAAVVAACEPPSAAVFRRISTSAHVEDRRQQAWRMARALPLEEALASAEKHFDHLRTVLLPDGVELASSWHHAVIQAAALSVVSRQAAQRQDELVSALAPRMVARAGVESVHAAMADASFERWVRRESLLIDRLTLVQTTSCLARLAGEGLSPDALEWALQERLVVGPVESAAPPLTASHVSAAGVAPSVSPIGRSSAESACDPTRSQSPTPDCASSAAAAVAGQGAHNTDGGSGELSADVISVACWNTQQLHVSCGEIDGVGDDVKGRSRAKLSWLDGQLQTDAPAVLGLLEVAGPRKEFGRLRRWLRQRGFSSQFLVGKAGRNGIVVAVRCSDGKLQRVTRLAERVAGLQVKCSADDVVRRVAFVHGLSGESKSECFDEAGCVVRSCFAGQLEEARSWLGEAGGGLLVGDLNRVPCVEWRAGTHSLTEDDRRVRRASSWWCPCCGGEAECDDRAEMVQGSCGWSRWATLKGVRGEPTSLIDYALALGREMGEWATRPAVAAGSTYPDGKTYIVSDHAYMTWQRFAARKVDVADRRPVAAPIGTRPRDNAAAREMYLDATRRNDECGAQLRSAAAGAEASGGAALAGVRDELVKAAHAAVASEAAARKVEQSRRAQHNGEGGSTAKQRFHSWIARLREALRLQRHEIPLDNVTGGVLFASKTGLDKLRKRRGGDHLRYELIIGRCRREAKRAGAALAKQQRGRDAQLYDDARALALSKEDAVVRMQRAWRAVREAQANVALEAVWEGDAPPTGKAGERRQRIAYSDPRFKGELKRIGERFVQQLASRPACVPAFEAWCELFLEAFPPLAGLDGEPFELRKELTWELFLEVIYTMPKGKSVGAGGFSIELLLAAGVDAQRAFYDAMMHDLAGQRVPSEWKTVLYALLVKSGNNPDVVSLRREIALMPQEMKLLLQMVRRASYQRIVGRVLHSQAGWLSGYGCSDPALVVAGVVQQARRLQRPLYLLYVDIATMFPAISRDALTVAEAVHGLPKEVRDLTLLIYGSADDPEGATTCHYDSAAGLGHGFKNWMGALMGCVLSPDRAKLFLNSVIAAVHAVVKGVRLWGHGSRDLADTWKRIAQAAFADDVCLSFSSEAELQKAWAIWRLWAKVSGSKLGVKQKLKTVVTGVRYVEGKAVSVVDPRLEMDDGSYVPFAALDEAYKHLGNWRCVNGDDREAWRRLKARLRVALARLRRLYKPSQSEFMMVSDALLGGLAGYYLQALYITFEQAEEVEREWRQIFRSKFREEFSDHRSKPRIYYYQARGKGRYQRRHLWAVGLSAVVSVVNHAIADVAETPQRAVARSMVALSMERWGCRSDPSTWSWQHLIEALESALRRSAGKYLGDAWMLATALLEREEPAEWERRSDARSKWQRDFSSECFRRWGRWSSKAPYGDPLATDAPHFAAPGSLLISEPTQCGGLGLCPEPWLLEAGVVAVGHMCKSSAAGGGAVWIESYEQARRFNQRLPRFGAAAKAWARQLGQLRAAGVQPTLPERVTRSGAAGVTVASAWAHTGQADGLAVVDSVDVAAVQRALGALSVPEVCARRSKDVWASSLRRCFPQVARAPAVEWAHGGRDRAAEAQACCKFFVLGRECTHVRQGGEQRWCARSHATYVPSGSDASGIAVGVDGFVVGWQARAAELQSSISYDAEGFALGADGQRVEGEALAALPPALQLQARARIEIESRVSEVVDEWPPTKREKTHVNLAVQRRNHDELARWQARIDATAAYATDGTRTVVKVRDASGKVVAWEYVVARGAGRHDGAVFGGGLHEPEGADNFIAELAALLDVLQAAEQGGRIIIVLDAISPPLAARRFARVCNRWKQGYYVGSWYDTLLRLLDRQEVVVFLWQTSHVGSPVNELADIIADDAAESLQTVPVPRLPDTHCSMRPTRPRKSTREWAAPLAMRVVEERLRGALDTSLAHDEFDVPPLTLTDQTQRLCEAVLCERCQIGDPKRHRDGVRSRLLGRVACPFGCQHTDGSPAPFTWRHVQFFCGHARLVAARRSWSESMDEAAPHMVDSLDMPHSQLQAVRELIEEGLPSTRRGVPACERALPPHLEKRARRAVGGLIGISGVPRADRAKVTRVALQAMVESGAKLQSIGRELTKELEERITQEAVALYRLAKWARCWRRAVVEGGPARVAALRAAQQTEGWACWHAARAAEAGRVSVADAVRWVERFEECQRRAHVQARDRFPRQGALLAYRQWRWLALLTRWRLRAALRQRSGDSELGAGATRVHVLASQWCTDASEELEVVHVPLAQPRGVQLEGVALAGLSLLSTEQTASAHWQRGCGRRGDVRRRRLQMEAVARRLVAVQRWGFERFMQRASGLEWVDAGSKPPSRGRKLKCAALASALQGGARSFTREQWQAFQVQGLWLSSYVVAGGRVFAPVRAETAAPTVGLSGQPLDQVGERLHLDIAPRGKRQRRRGPSDSHEAQRTAAEPGYDRWGRWPVDRVYEVRRVQTAAGSYYVEARLRWSGVVPPGQLGAGLPYPDEWKRVRDDDGGQLMSPALRKEVGAMERVKYGARARPRCAPVRAAVGPRPANARRSARLRPGWEAVEEEERIRPPAVRRRWRVVEESEGSEEEEEAPIRPPAARRRRLRVVAESSEEEGDEE